MVDVRPKFSRTLVTLEKLDTDKQSSLFEKEIEVTSLEAHEKSYNTESDQEQAVLP